MTLTIISTILGLLSSTVPGILNYFLRKRELEYETRIAELKIEAAKNGLELSRDIADIKAVVDEGNNIRDNDSKLDGGGFINSLRASVRPVITYSLFAVFIGVKLVVATVILSSVVLNASNIKLVLDAILDENTMAVITTILAYYFGARTLEKMQSSTITKVVPQAKLTNLKDK